MVSSSDFYLQKVKLNQSPGIQREAAHKPVIGPTDV